MMKQQKYIWLLLLLTVQCCVLFAQDQTSNLLGKFETFRKQNIQEKIYVHTDQSLYLTGETIWFSIYCVDASLHKPLSLSKVAYIEILDSENNAVIQTKVRLTNGSGSGSLYLSALLNNGNFTLRAYTNWMKNSPAEYYFQKTITIINTLRKSDTRSASQPAFDVQFFPEGGMLVEGLKSKVAFRAVDQSGYGIDFKGVIVNSKNDTILAFSPHKFGIGHFSFTPVANEEYRAVLRNTTKILGTFKLPSASHGGYTLYASDSSKTLDISISATEPTEDDPSVYLFVHSRGRMAFIEKRFLRKGTALFEIPRQSLPEGISHITLFNSNLKPVCERLYFKQPENTLSININSDQHEYGLRRKVTLDLKSMNHNQGEVTNLSLSVYKMDSLAIPAEGNILTSLILTSDLKGTVESPEYYLNNTSDTQAIDNLMLTHGWRRFNWDQVLHPENLSNQFLPEFRGHIIYGKVTNQDGNPLSGVTTYLASPGKNVRLYTSKSNSSGEVRFEMPDYEGARKIILQTNSNQDSTAQLEVLNPFSKLFGNRSLNKFSLDPDFKDQLLARSIAMQVQNIYSEAKLHPPKVTQDSIPFYGTGDEVYYLDDYTRFPVMEEVLREYVKGVLVRKRKDGFHFMVVDHLNSAVFREDPLILLDGVPIFDTDKIMTFDPLKVKKLDVLTGRYYHNELTFPGIVSFSTYAGDLSGFEFNSKNLTLDYDGLQLNRDFFVPKYDTPAQRESRTPDQRNLLFWAPQLKTGSDGNLKIEFYTSDLDGQFNIQVEGLTKDGKPGYGSSSFLVRRYNN